MMSYQLSAINNQLKAATAEWRRGAAFGGKSR